jgi:hypothetical protein
MFGLVLGLGACGDKRAGRATANAERPAGSAAPTPPPAPLVTMRCSDATAMPEAKFDEGDFRVHAIPGTDADRDRKEIAGRRKKAIAEISARLDVTEDRIVELWLSPNRAAAAAHGLSAGQTRRARVEVLYLGAPESYERLRYGHEMTHVVTQNLDHDRRHLPLVDEGVAEVFDQSGRDLHRAFAQIIRADGKTVDEALVTPADESTSVKYPKAGSFMKRLFEKNPDPKPFRAFFRDVRVAFRGEIPLDPAGNPLDAAAIDAMLDSALRKSYGLDLASFRAEWKRILEPLVASPTLVSAEDASAIASVLDAREWAVAHHDAAAYRATMDGFYCIPDWDDAKREAVAAEVVAGSRPRARVVEIFDTGLKNFRTAAARVAVEGEGSRTILLEKFPDPIGYRVTGDRPK